MIGNLNSNPLSRKGDSLWSMGSIRVLALVLIALNLAVAMLALLGNLVSADVCTYWVAPAGDNGNPGTLEKPWATLEYASNHLPDTNCTVWIEKGTYVGEVHLVSRFERMATFRAIDPYQVILENRGTVLNFDGARNIVIEGLVLRHSGSGGDAQVVKVDRSSEAWSENIILRNNIFHDSYNDDLLKIYNGVRFVTVENNIFFNQAGSEEHIDINSVTDVIIQDNIFFNDFVGSGRINSHDTKSFITIKDSNGDDDHQIGSERIWVRRNLFLNWEGGRETLIQVGNDGKPYYEANEVWIENNLMVGNGTDPLYAAFGARGVKNITFANNTVVGDLPSSAYGMWVSGKDENPVNKNIYFSNNIWSDPTGTMGVNVDSAGKFSHGDPSQTEQLIVDNNLYWNGGKQIPPGELVSPRRDDKRRIEADPRLNTNQDGIVLPRWNGASFASGSTSIRNEFIRLVEAFGKIKADSPAIGRSDPKMTPSDDILGQSRVGTPDIGAYEYYPLLMGGARLTEISLDWSDFDEPKAASYAISYTNGEEAHVIANLPPTAVAYTLTDLVPYSLYSITVIARDADNRVLSQSAPLVLMTSNYLFALPFVSNAED